MSSFDAAVDSLERLDDRAVAALPAERLRALIAATLRLYDRACEQAGGEIPPAGPDVPATAAIRMACALARSQNLTPFDLALWFSHTAPRDGIAHE